MDDFNTRLVAEMPQLRRYAQALTRDTSRAEDLTQTCLLRALVKQDLWQAGTNLRSWLMTIMHNQHISEIRRSRRADAGSAAFSLAAATSTEPAADDAVLLGEVGAAIAGLPEAQQPIIALACVQGLDYRHVAARLRIPEGTVRSRLSRARASLRAILDDGERKIAVADRDRGPASPRVHQQNRGRDHTAPARESPTAPLSDARFRQAGAHRRFAAHPPARPSSPRSEPRAATAAVAS